MSPRTRKAPAAPPGRPDGPDLPRLQLELALELTDADDCPLAEKIAQASAAAGADLLFVLPSPDGTGMAAMVRLSDAGADRFLQIKTAERGMVVAEEAEADPLLLRLARAAVDVLQRIGSDASVRAPLAAAS